MDAEWWSETKVRATVDAVRPEIASFEVKTTVATGQAQNVERLGHKYVQFANLHGATLQIEGSIDGTNFLQVGSNVTTAGFVSIAETIRFLRIKTTVAPTLTGGDVAPSAFIMGVDYRAA